MNRSSRPGLLLIVQKVSNLPASVICCTSLSEDSCLRFQLSLRLALVLPPHLADLDQLRCRDSAMPPKYKYRPYRKPKQDKEPENDKPPVFGPEPPPGFVPAPAPRSAAARETKPAHSTVQHATTAIAAEATGNDAASAEQVHGQAAGERHQDCPDGGGRGAGRGGRGGRGGGRAGREGQYRRKKLPRKRIDDKAGGWDEDHLERPLDEADQDRYSE